MGKWKMKLERFIQSVRAMKDSTETFALCIDPAGAEDLEKGKVYRVLRDTSAEEEGLLRVIDESAEDYLYPSACFVFIDLPQKAREALAIDA
jgi:hypothetical protein